MIENATQSERFEPLHDAHAIEQVVIVLQMAGPVGGEVFASVRKTSEQFKNDLPGQAEIQKLTVAFGQDPGFMGQPAQSEVHGFVMSRTAPNGVVETELRLEQSSITFRTTVYTRWNSVWAQAKNYLDIFTPLYVRNGSVAAISLNFVDKFVWVGDIAGCSPKLLLRPASKYVAPHVFELGDLWHSHTGAFLPADSQVKRLLNVNVDYLQEEPIAGPRRLIGISTSLTDLFNQPGYDPLQLDPNAVPQFLNDRMNDLHRFSKVAFGEVISANMSKRVALSIPS